MQEVFKLLLLLAVAVVCNILGGVYVNINLNKIRFSWKAFLTGVAKAICVAIMFIGLAYIIESVPSLAESLGVEPKAMIVSAIVIYATKTVGHLNTIFGYKKEVNVAAVENTVKEVIDEFVDM